MSGVLLLGGTDLTLAVAERLLVLDLAIAGVIHVGDRFEISYSADGVSNVRAAAIPEWCEQHGIPARVYDGRGSLLTAIAEFKPEIGLAAGWYHMVPGDARDAVPRGFVGLHASLLPRLRGGAPLNWAILLGHDETGMTLFELDDGVDDGAVFGQRGFPIGRRTEVGELVRLAEAAALDLVSETLPSVLSGERKPVPQEGTPSYCLQRTPDDGIIDWHSSADEIDRLVRAVSAPYPGARTTLDGEQLVVWQAEPAERTELYGVPGQIAVVPGFAEPLVVTGNGALRLISVSNEAGEPALEELRAAGNRRLH